MPSERGRPDLEQLLERAECRRAARGTRRRARPSAACARASCRRRPARRVVRSATSTTQVLRDHAHGVRAAGPGRPGDRAHHRHPPAAGDQRVPAGRDAAPPTARPGRAYDGGIRCRRRAEDADRRHVRRSLGVVACTRLPQLGGPLARPLPARIAAASASTIDAPTASSTSSVTCIRSRSAAPILPPGSTVARSQSTSPPSSACRTGSPGTG